MKSLKSIIFLFSVLLIALQSHAFRVPMDNRPIITYSENHDYYAVSVPKKFTGSGAFTAVFKTDTKELVFKIDSLNIYDFKVSNDGQFIYSLTFEMDSDIQKWYIRRYSKSTVQPNPFFVYSIHLQKIELGGYLYPELSWKLFSDRIEMVSEEDQVTVNIPDFKILSVPRDKNVEWVYDYDYNRDSDSLFGLNLLQSDSSSYFTKDLAAFLGYREMDSKPECEKYVFVKFIILEDGTFSDVKVFAQFGKKSSVRVGEVDKEWIAKIQEYISSYHFAKETVPKGAPYWFYSGPLYLVK